MLRPDLPVSAERWARTMAVFDAAVERPEAQRAAFVVAACGTDAALRSEVDSLLAAAAVADAADDFLEAPATFGADAAETDFGDAAAAGVIDGRRVGPYRLVRELGRGGMGAVYLAERDDVGRRVALKLVRGGLAAPERVARFLVERRVLARLDHPRISRLLDAGVVDDGSVDDGTPWFAMEYVCGEPLDRYCDGRRLPVAERLRLVEQACEAVAYAHRNLVVHRDLKPSNLLVDADGAVMLLDFGIAKLLGDSAGDGAGLTEAGMRLLTPEYAAPEQVRGEPVTTATDVYALGVVLYELLAGCRPARRLRGSLDVFAAAGPFGGWLPPTPAEPGPAAVSGPRFRPPPPSVATSRPTTPGNGTRTEAGTAPLDAAAVAAARSTTPERLRRQLAGDLDTIVLKALDPDPERRYASAAALLDDLRRYRTGFPVRARPDSRAYRAHAFVRRNRWGVAAAAGLFALLAVTAAVTTVQRVRTAQAQARTARALARATAEAAKAREVTRFVVSLFGDLDPYQTSPRAGVSAAAHAAADALFGIGVGRLERELVHQPTVRAELLRALGVVGRNLGRYDDADALLRRGVAVRRQVLAAPGGPGVGPNAAPDAELAALLHELGVVRRAKGDLAGADTLLAQALAARAVIPGARGTDLSATRFELGMLRRFEGRYAEAERLLRSAIAVEQASPGPALADALLELGAVRLQEGDAAAGVTHTRQAIALREQQLGPAHPGVAQAYIRLSVAERNAHQLSEAERAINRALEIQRVRLPADHPDRLNAESERSWVLSSQGAYAEAERVQRSVLAARRRLYGDVHRDVAGSLFTLGALRYSRGDPAGAVPLLRRAVATYAQALGPDVPEVVQARRELAAAEAARGHDAAALAEAARVVRATGATAGDPTVQALTMLAALLRDHADCRRAAAFASRALAANAARHRDLPPGDTIQARLRTPTTPCRSTWP